MLDERFGRSIRVLRRRQGLRQVDVAGRASVPQSTVSLIERGRIDGLQVRTVRAVARAVDATWDPAVRWRGGELDRLLDEAHAGLVGRAVADITRLGWEMRAEVSYAVYGERGSIDLLGWHPPARLLLVVEVKTALTSIEETLRRHDTKVRLAQRIADERFGWRAVGTAAVLVLPDSSTARRQVGRHDAVLRAAYPLRGDDLRAWLRQPRARASGILFLPAIARGAAIRSGATPLRVRQPARPMMEASSHPAIVRDDE
jgi:transcriptional regulator with XRE-family HTH domain